MNVPERSAPHLPEKARSAKSPCEGKAMDLADLIEPDRVIFAARASNKQQLLQDLASRAVTLLNLDAQTIFTALQAREELGSTGLGNGFALPHRRARPTFWYVCTTAPAGPFRLNRRQSCRSRVSSTYPASRCQRASRRPRLYLEVPARQGIRREIAQSAERCRTVQPTLQFPAFVMFGRLSYNATPPRSAAQSRTELQSYFLTISTSRVCGILHSERSSTSSPINSSGSMRAKSVKLRNRYTLLAARTFGESPASHPEQGWDAFIKLLQRHGLMRPLK